MTSIKRALSIATLLLAPVCLNGQTTSEDDQGWSFAQRFQGSANAAGTILKTTSTATYNFNRYLKAYAGLPVYFARATSSTGSTSFVNGIGNVYSGFLVTAGGSALHYTSDLMATAPTGDTSSGFSTGHPTIDWTNTFSHTARFFTPYASIGAANTISDTSFFVRPFTSKGIVGHYEAGSLINLTSHVGFGGSLYGVRATGPQEIISKVVKRTVTVQGTSTPTTTVTTSTTQGTVGSTVNQVTGVVNGVTNGVNGAANGVANGQNTAVFETTQQTLGPAAVANDNGFSAWVMLRPTSSSDLQIGYSRSNTYELDSLFFGIGFHFGHYSVSK